MSKVVGYKVRHNGLITKSEVAYCKMYNNKSKQYLFTVDGDFAIMLFYKPMTVSEALDYSKVDREHLIIK